eukprot:jgi/Mesvir1/23775/Mv25224-RA.1
MGPPSTHPTTALTLPCLTATGRVATCSSMSPWLGRSPVATSSGRLWMPALLPLWLSATSVPPTAMWGPTGRVIPFVLEEFGAMGPKTAEFFHECCGQRREDRLGLEGQTAPAVVCPHVVLVLAAAPVTRPHLHRG